MSKRLRLLGICCVLSLGLTDLAFGQLDRGTIAGLVSDPSGAVLTDARITVVNGETNATSTTTSTQTGNYTVSALPIGKYQVQVEAGGFKRAIRDNVIVSAASTVRLDVTLEIGSTTESIEVGAVATPLDTESTRVGTNITRKLVDDVPLEVNGQIRSVFDLALLAPEAKASVTGLYRIAGGQDAGWDLVQDGTSIAVTSAIYQQSRSQIVAVPIDAINEFTVETTGMKAEYGRAMGMVNFVTKSGTNDYHGNAFEFLRNDALDARGFFAQTRPRLKQHDFGGTFGGPVHIPKLYNGRNKTFFFVSYEGFRSRQGNAAAFYTIPLPSMYKGDFSGWVNKAGATIPIYDPATTRPNPAGPGYIRDQFPGNQIPVSRFDSVAAKYLTLVPSGMVPNIAGPTNNYFFQHGSMEYPWDKGTLRMDHRLTEKDTISGFVMRGQNQDAPGPEGAPGLPYPFTQGPPFWTRKETSALLTWNRIITPRLVNSLRYHIQHGEGSILGTDCSSPQMHWGALLGLVNVPGPDQCIPQIAMTSYTPWAGIPNNGAWGVDNGRDWSINEDLTWVRGRHTFKGGFFISKNEWDGGGQHTPNGQYGFSQLATAVPGDQSQNTGNAFASFLLGYVDNAGLQTPRRVLMIWKYWAGYFQDDWRVTPKLTLNLGLRYEYTFPLVGGGSVPNTESGFSNFDPTVPNPGAAGRLGAIVFTGKGPGRTGTASPFDGYKKAFGPRVGVAYALRPGTVLRLSAGEFFEAVKTQGGSTHYDGFIGTLSWASTDLDTLNFPMILSKGLPPWSPPPFLVPQIDNGQSSIDWWQRNQSGRPPNFWTWNFDIQQQLAASTVLTARYTGMKGSHLTSGLTSPNQINPSYLTTLGPALLTSNINSAAAKAAGIASPYTGFNGTVAQALSPFPQYQAITQGLEHLGDSTYHAMIITLDRRFSGGLTWLASYSLSKALTDADSVVSGSRAMDTFNLRLAKSLSADDQTHSIRSSLSYDLPFGKSKRFLAGGFASQVLGGWTIATTQSYSSGLPVAVGSGITLPIGGGADQPFITSYTNWRAPVSGGSFDPFKNSWWDKSAFNQVPQTVLATQMGNSTIYNPKARLPWTLNENANISRNLKVTEQVRLIVRFEAFNFFNRHIWAAPASSLTDPSFGLVRAQANNPRQMQAALKLVF